MQNVKIQSFKVIGIATRTTNENGQSAQDIGALWQRFMSEGVQAQIPNKLDSSILSIYTHYEKDHTRPYDTILACRVSSLDEVPEGMVGVEFDGGTFHQSLAKGDLTQGAVYHAWSALWELNLDRAYTVDFEEYGAGAQNPQDAEVDIFVALKS